MPAILTTAEALFKEDKNEPDIKKTPLPVEEKKAGSYHDSELSELHNLI